MGYIETDIMVGISAHTNLHTLPQPDVDPYLQPTVILDEFRSPKSRRCDMALKLMGFEMSGFA
jgi:hypothetical protein